MPYACCVCVRVRAGVLVGVRAGEREGGLAGGGLGVHGCEVACGHEGAGLGACVLVCADAWMPECVWGRLDAKVRIMFAWALPWTT